MTQVTGWLKTAVVQANKPKHSIIELLRNGLKGYETGRPRSVLHASDVTKSDFCPRNEALMDIDGITHGHGMYVPASLRATWDVGSATARVLIEQWGGDHVLGNWRCRRCGFQLNMTYKIKRDCDVGSGLRCDFEYHEVVVKSSATSISGAVDVLFFVGVPKVMVTELKIMAVDDFDKIVIPLPEHRLRTNLYLKLISDAEDFMYKDLINLHEGRVLYTSRGHGRANPAFNNEVLPWKEFEIVRDDDALTGVLAKATQLKVFRETGEMPGGVCKTPLDKIAKGCKNCAACFSGKHPAVQPSLVGL